MRFNESRAELIEANEYTITVKITPSANEVNIQNNVINIKTSKNERKRRRKGKHGYSFKYRNSFKTTHNIKEEIHDYESEKDNSEMYGYYKHEKQNKRSKKMMYKKSKEALSGSPQTVYKLGNIDKRFKRGDIYGYRGLPGLDPNGTYYVVPTSRLPPNPYAFYNPSFNQDSSSPIYVKLDKKFPRDKLTHFYAPFFGMPPQGTCPGCGGKTPLIPARTPTKQEAPSLESEPDFLMKISRSS